MSKKNTIKFQQILASMMAEVMFGRTHYEIVRGLGRRDSIALAAKGIAPQFFDLTLDSHAVAAQLAVARVFDRTSAVSIHTLLSAALGEAGTFKHGTPAQVRKAVEDAKATITALAPTLAAIRTRRNETIAHLDAKPFKDPASYHQRGRVSYRQIDEVFEKVSTVLTRLSLLYRNAAVPLELEGAKDYERVFEMLAAAKTQLKPPIAGK